VRKLCSWRYVGVRLTELCMYSTRVPRAHLHLDRHLSRPSWLYENGLLPVNEEIYLPYSNQSFTFKASIIEHISNDSMPSALEIVGVAAASASAILAVAGLAYKGIMFAKTKYVEHQSSQQQQQDTRDVIHRLPYVLYLKHLLIYVIYLR
jgi:hypothetical protein